MLLCYYKTPSMGQWSYSISSMHPVGPDELYRAAQNRGTDVGSIWPNEMHVGQCIIGGCSLLMTALMIKTIRDQHSHHTKRHDTDPEKKQKGKSFEDIGGCEKAKEAVKQIIDYIRVPEQYKKMGVRMPKGILLYGPPGTGKTLIAKAAATEAKIPMLYCSGSEFVELYVGLGAKRVRDLFT